MTKKNSTKPKKPLQELETLGGKIQKAREARGYTVKQAARRLGVLPKTFSNWETNSSEPRANQLQMLSGVLNVPSIWLLGNMEQSIDEDNIPQLSETTDLDRRLRKLIKTHSETSQLLFDMQVELRRLQNNIDTANSKT